MVEKGPGLERVTKTGKREGDWGGTLNDKLFVNY